MAKHQKSEGQIKGELPKAQVTAINLVKHVAEAAKVAREQVKK